MTKEDKTQRQLDDHNPNNPYVDNTGYRGTGLSKWEWLEKKADDDES